LHDNGVADAWLFEHSQRVMQLAVMLTELPELAGDRIDRLGVALAGLFAAAGWAVQASEDRVNRWQVLGRPTNDIQRELGASLMEEEIRHLVPADSLRQAALAIRQCNNRSADLREAQLVAEAEGLEGVGVLYVLRQFRQQQAEGRSLQHLLESWNRQREYRYWDTRIEEGLRFDATRKLARQRLAAIEEFMAALARDVAAGDVRSLLGPAGEQQQAGHQ